MAKNDPKNDYSTKIYGKPPTPAKPVKKAGKATKASDAHPGFAALVKKGVPAAALAASTRKASAKARKANPRLDRVAKKGQTKASPKSAARGK